MNSSEDNISLFELASRYPNLTITVKCSDLIDAFRTVLHEEKLMSEQLSQKKNTEVLLTEKEVQDILEVSHSTLWRWHKEEYLVPVQIGRKIRYKQSDVLEIKKQN